MNEKILEILRKNNYPDGEHDDDEICAIELEQLFDQEVEKRIKERMPTKEVIVQYFNNHFDCHTDVIIGDYETNEIAMTSTAVLRLFNWLRNQITER